jgi:hypothetical protein
MCQADQSNWTEYPLLHLQNHSSATGQQLALRAVLVQQRHRFARAGWLNKE